MVCISDVKVPIEKKIAQLVGINFNTESETLLPTIRILDPNPGKNYVLKYKYN